MSRNTWIAAGAVYLLVAAALAGVFLYAPTEKTMGDIQRIFYFHVSSAWVSFLAFFLACVFSIIFLAKRDLAWDRRAASCAELGVLFCSLVLITGPLWARPVWGVWWTWDIRLSTTLVLWLMYAAYLILRSVVVDPQRRAAVAAVVAVIGFVNVPLSYLSIRWWRTQHPSPVLAGGSASGLDPAMRVAFFISLAAFTALFLYLLQRRVQLAAAEGKIEYLYRRLDHLKVQGARRS